MEVQGQNNPTKISTHKKGMSAEDMAVAYIEKLNFDIVKRNFRFGQLGEIDIIAKDKDILVFVEVKSARTKEYGDPVYFINQGKQKQIRKIAEAYLYINKITNTDCRFDAVIIDYTEKPPKLTYFKDAM
ncbi:MAG: endonuclease [Ignavibacteria bacterium]|nr:endonuclease [Ignavibacteria bacterium]